MVFLSLGTIGVDRSYAGLAFEYLYRSSRLYPRSCVYRADAIRYTTLARKGLSWDT